MARCASRSFARFFASCSAVRLATPLTFVPVALRFLPATCGEEGEVDSIGEGLAVLAPSSRAGIARRLGNIQYKGSDKTGRTGYHRMAILFHMIIGLCIGFLECRVLFRWHASTTKFRVIGVLGYATLDWWITIGMVYSGTPYLRPPDEPQQWNQDRRSMFFHD